MNPAVERVAAALAALCFRAGVSADDGSEAAGLAVGAVLARELKTAPHEVFHCPLNEWVRKEAGVPRAVVTDVRVVLPNVVTGELPRSEARQEQRGSRGRTFAQVELPPAVRSAVALYDALKWTLPEVA